MLNTCLLLSNLWEDSLLEKLDGETFRIKDCNKPQIESFNFFLGLCLGQKRYGLTDNLSETFQRRRCQPLVASDWFLWPWKHGKVRSGQDLDLFYELILNKAFWKKHQQSVISQNNQENKTSHIISCCSILVIRVALWCVAWFGTICTIWKTWKTLMQECYLECF